MQLVLCPIYAAGEKVDVKFDNIEFAKLSKLSRTQVIIINDLKEIEKFLKKNLIEDK